LSSAIDQVTCCNKAIATIIPRSTEDVYFWERDARKHFHRDPRDLSASTFHEGDAWQFIDLDRVPVDDPQVFGCCDGYQ
jgi:hypothetical protein